MIIVHHLENSRSQRILWLLEELGIPYELKRYARDPATMLAPATLRAVHPLGKSPVITDGGQTIAESGAIVEYLVGRYGDGRLVPPPDTPERLRYTYWLHYAEGSAMPPLLLKLIFERMPKGPMPGLMRPLVRRIAGRVLQSFVDPQITHASELSRRRAGAQRLVRRRCLYRGRHPDEFPGRGSRRARWPRRVTARSCGAISSAFMRGQPICVPSTRAAATS